jgi:hypothetical protein
VYKRGMGWAEAYKKTRFDNGMCAFSKCPNKRVLDRKMCQDCLNRVNEQGKKRRQKLSKNGLCVSCKEKEYLPCFVNEKTKTYKRCQTCYLKNISTRYFGFPDYYQELLDMLEKQNFRCAYSGETIVLGVNDSLDHIIPRHRYPQKVRYIKNVHWTTRDINKMKNGLDESRFLGLCEMVVEQSLRPTFEDSLDRAKD